MADGRGARDAATRNIDGDRGKGTVELDGLDDPILGLTRKDVTIETKNKYGGRTDKATFKQLDKVVREMVVKYDRNKVVRERVYKSYKDGFVTEQVVTTGGVDTVRVYRA